jgi:hypothetical protein
MLFFFTLGASMVGDICDEDDLATGHRSEGSYYAVFWWFIKMGTALASFVAGVLIVFTMFDETQVTRVDSLQGSIKELRARVQYWKDYQGLVATDASWIEATASERSLALKESKDYVVFLEKESLKKPEGKNKALPAYPEQRKALLLTALTTTRATVNGLEQLQMDLDKAAVQTLTTETPALIEKAISLTLQTKLEKSRIYSFELKSHLDAKAIEVKKSPEHYETLSKNMKEVDDRLALMNPLLSLNVFDEELGNIENKMVLLKKQTPYTLLMMRVVEIGLPLLLSLISIFFILRYSLTEERSHEIKELIRKRNLERL